MAKISISREPDVVMRVICRTNDPFQEAVTIQQEHICHYQQNTDDSSIAKSGTDFVREGSNVRKWLM